MMQTDLLIIGAGPGGYRAAEYAAKQGLQVVIIEQDEVGGTCLNRGCIPTKTFVHSASFAEAVERQQQVVSQLRSGVEGILSAPGITLVRGHAAFADARSVSVGDDIISARHIIIATGSSAKMPPIEGLDDPRVMTSTGLLQLRELPKRLCIIGAGVIGMEFASVFQRFGTEVTVIEFLKECLPMLDSDVAKRLRKLMEKAGIVFKMKTAVHSVDDIDADAILIATGRKANTEGLNLAAAGITLAPNGTIPVDDNFMINALSSVYAIGDVNGRQMLAHAAEMQAMRVVNHIVGKSDGIRFDVMPAAIFTKPEAACVGVSEDQLKEQGVDYKCHKSFWRANGKALAMNESEGLLKLLADTDGRILGCHAFGAHAADIIQEVSVLMCRDTTVCQLRDMVHIHPTLSEVLKAAVE
ncbi:NAD(P)/FAD-dependent oxidoreductase [Prevotella sp. tc2-28]|uniref:dihydrolipoyl dehydrogenase family protein n=1 Tax=Prevotella sp. tc2-28 TaxID=1761888 RepID=UPI000B82555A|nr:NAD(P)/FAD-dependent oxidoreductase [Prevotella sp. tc2-28]